jgi:hypothetical protein
MKNTFGISVYSKEYTFSFSGLFCIDVALLMRSQFLFVFTYEIFKVMINVEIDINLTIIVKA